MASLNKVQLIGNLGADPETRYTASGDAVCNLRIATTEKWKDKNSGEQREATEWHRVVFYRKLAEVAGQYLRKGSQVYIEGKLVTRKWQDKDGQDKYTTEIQGVEMVMLGSASGGRSTNDNGPSQHQQDKQDGYQPAPERQQKPKPRPTFDDLGDDIPF